ncbi:DUF4366 domain-containing protein [Thomasclavelia spiroformis]|uniref:DUF4366 domain-containing protein n=1 Tax=Thomasclavelia spiroformis TaxID=29348 RepID=UPI0026DBB4B9|nr:DUF4366 domain-containing protein [Thomasclavelia spiroformis]
MKNKLIAVMAAFLMSASFFIFPVNAKANSGETTPPPTTEAQESQEETETPKENDNALTPDGNMTLVDDISSTANSNKQFITLVTKTGNYFYLIIDRDDKGNNTVHFLNQVDEEDLFSLMKEEDAQAIKDEIEKQKESVKEKTETVTVVEKEEKEGSRMNLNFTPLVVVIGLSVLAGGAFFFAKTKKEKSNEMKPDPDADYLIDDEEDDLFDFPEDKLEEENDENKV